MRTLLILSIIAGCTGDDPCDALCDAVVRVQSGCLPETGWEGAGFDSAEDRRDRCQTWAWEVRILAHDAGASDAVDPLCEAYTDELTPGSCEAYAGIDWNALPWQSTP